MRTLSRPIPVLAALSCIFLAFLPPAFAMQQVYLDFTTYPGNLASPAPGQANQTKLYSPSEQSQILASVAADYSAFDYSFSLMPFASGLYSTLFFNDPAAGAPVSAGLADDVDFRNLIPNDNAAVNLNGWLIAGASSDQWVTFTSDIAAHELGHLSGLRHADAYGPIGQGITITPGADAYTPTYPGFENAGIVTFSHIMSTPVIGGSFMTFPGPVSFGAREDVKLAFNQSPAVTPEQSAPHNTLLTAQPITAPSLNVPNTELTSFPRKTFLVNAVDVTGNIATSGESDLYRIDNLVRNRFLEIEVMATTLPPGRTSGLDTYVTVYNSVGNILSYGDDIAINDNEFETTDSTIIDLKLPADGTYYIQVNASPNTTSGFPTGNYELFAYTFAAVPEPQSLAILIAAVLIPLRRQRRSVRMSGGIGEQANANC